MGYDEPVAWRVGTKVVAFGDQDGRKKEGKKRSVVLLVLPGQLAFPISAAALPRETQANRPRTTAPTLYSWHLRLLLKKRASESSLALPSRLRLGSNATANLLSLGASSRQLGGSLRAFQNDRKGQVGSDPTPLTTWVTTARTGQTASPERP